MLRTTTTLKFGTTILRGLQKIQYSFNPEKLAVPIISNFLSIRDLRLAFHTEAPSMTYTIGKWDKPSRLSGLSRWRMKGHMRTSVSVCLPLYTYCLLGFQNKFSPPFKFETGARIEPLVAESAAGG